MTMPSLMLLITFFRKENQKLGNAKIQLWAIFVTLLKKDLLIKNKAIAKSASTRQHIKINTDVIDLFIETFTNFLL